MIKAGIVPSPGNNLPTGQVQSTMFVDPALSSSAVSQIDGNGNLISGTSGPYDWNGDVTLCQQTASTVIDNPQLTIDWSYGINAGPYSFNPLYGGNKRGGFLSYSPTYVLVDQTPEGRTNQISGQKMSIVSDPSQLCFIYDGMWYNPANFSSNKGLGASAIANIYVYGRHNRPSSAGPTDQVGTVNICMLDGSVGAYHDSQLATTINTRFGGMISMGPGWNILPTFNINRLLANQ